MVHYHPRKQYGPGLMKQLLNDPEWNDADLHRLRMIKQRLMRHSQIQV